MSRPQGKSPGGAPLILASASPRRAEILRILGVPFSVDGADVDESVLPGESPDVHVRRLAGQKAAAVAARHPGALVLAGDTVVVVDGRVLGKPQTEAEAEGMLLDLAGRSHEVLTGLALSTPDGDRLEGVATTRVNFRPFDRAFARGYVATGEPMDKAGAYGIQGAGAALVAGIQGDYFNVVGLPVPLLLDLLQSAGHPYRFGPLPGGGGP